MVKNGPRIDLSDETIADGLRRRNGRDTRQVARGVGAAQLEACAAEIDRECGTRVFALTGHILDRMITAATTRVARISGRAWLLGMLLALTGTVAPAAQPAQGMLLIASPDMGGSWFEKTVVLLIQHDEFGSVGLVINRPTDMAPVEVLPDIAGLGQFRGKLYVGGPVEAYAVMMLIRSDRVPPDAEHVFDDVYASGSQELLREMVESGESAGRVRLYAGYAGWVPGQLEAEIRRGSWTVVTAAEQHVFSAEPGSIWKQLAPPTRPIIVRRAERVTAF